MRTSSTGLVSIWEQYLALLGRNCTTKTGQNGACHQHILCPVLQTRTFISGVSAGLAFGLVNLVVQMVGYKMGVCKRLTELVQIPVHFDPYGCAEGLMCRHTPISSMVFFFVMRKLRTGLRVTKFEYMFSSSRALLQDFLLPLLVLEGFAALWFLTAGVNEEAANFEARIKVQPLHLGLCDWGNVARHWQ